jgi:hypothetical protein
MLSLNDEIVGDVQYRLVCDAKIGENYGIVKHREVLSCLKP